VVFTYELLPFEVKCVAHTVTSERLSVITQFGEWTLLLLFFTPLVWNLGPSRVAQCCQDLWTVSSYRAPFRVELDSDARTPALKEKDM
jgi:predicted ABC-type exoprotein transport system permease subunit